MITLSRQPYSFRSRAESESGGIPLFEDCRQQHLTGYSWEFCHQGYGLKRLAMVDLRGSGVLVASSFFAGAEENGVAGDGAGVTFSAVLRRSLRLGLGLENEGVCFGAWGLPFWTVILPFGEICILDWLKGSIWIWTWFCLFFREITLDTTLCESWKGSFLAVNGDTCVGLVVCVWWEGMYGDVSCVCKGMSASGSSSRGGAGLLGSGRIWTEAPDSEGGVCLGMRNSDSLEDCEVSLDCG